MNLLIQSWLAYPTADVSAYRNVVRQALGDTDPKARIPDASVDFWVDAYQTPLVEGGTTYVVDIYKVCIMVAEAWSNVHVDSLPAASESMLLQSVKLAKIRISAGDDDLTIAITEQILEASEIAALRSALEAYIDSQITAGVIAGLDLTDYVRTGGLRLAVSNHDGSTAAHGEIRRNVTATKAVADAASSAASTNAAEIASHEATPHIDPATALTGISRAVPEPVAAVGTAGSSNDASDAGHVHAGSTLSVSDDPPADLATSAHAGTSSDAARSRHVHSTTGLATQAELGVIDQNILTVDATAAQAISDAVNVQTALTTHEAIPHANNPDQTRSTVNSFIAATDGARRSISADGLTLTITVANEDRASLHNVLTSAHPDIRATLLAHTNTDHNFTSALTTAFHGHNASTTAHESEIDGKVTSHDNRSGAHPAAIAGHNDSTAHHVQFATHEADAGAHTPALTAHNDDDNAHNSVANNYSTHAADTSIHGGGSANLTYSGDTPAALTVNGTAGSGDALARATHAHPLTGIATTVALTTALTTHSSNASHPAVSGDSPRPLADAAAAGSDGTVSDSGHVHPNTGLVSVSLLTSTTAALTSVISSSIATHTSAQPHIALSAATPQPLTANGTPGTGDKSSNEGHVHPSTGLATDVELAEHAATQHGSTSVLYSTIPEQLTEDGTVGDSSEHSPGNHAHPLTGIATTAALTTAAQTAATARTAAATLAAQNLAAVVTTTAQNLATVVTNTAQNLTAHTTTAAQSLAQAESTAATALTTHASTPHASSAPALSDDDVTGGVATVSGTASAAQLKLAVNTHGSDTPTRVLTNAAYVALPDSEKALDIVYMAVGEAASNDFVTVSTAVPQRLTTSGAAGGSGEVSDSGHRHPGLDINPTDPDDRHKIIGTSRSDATVSELYEFAKDEIPKVAHLPDFEDGSPLLVYLTHNVYEGLRSDVILTPEFNTALPGWNSGDYGIEYGMLTNDHEHAFIRIVVDGTVDEWDFEELWSDNRDALLNIRWLVFDDTQHPFNPDINQVGPLYFRRLSSRVRTTNPTAPINIIRDEDGSYVFVDSTDSILYQQGLYSKGEFEYGLVEQNGIFHYSGAGAPQVDPNHPGILRVNDESDIYVSSGRQGFTRISASGSASAFSDPKLAADPDTLADVLALGAGAFWWIGFAGHVADSFVQYETDLPASYTVKSWVQCIAFLADLFPANTVYQDLLDTEFVGEYSSDQSAFNHVDIITTTADFEADTYFFGNPNLPTPMLRVIDTFTSSDRVDVSNLHWVGPMATTGDIRDYITENFKVNQPDVGTEEPLETFEFRGINYDVLDAEQRHLIAAVQTLQAKTANLLVEHDNERTWAPATAAQATIAVFENDPNSADLTAATWTNQTAENATTTFDRTWYGLRIPVDGDLHFLRIFAHKSNSATGFYVNGTDLWSFNSDLTYRYVGFYFDHNVPYTFEVQYDDVINTLFVGNLNVVLVADEAAALALPASKSVLYGFA